MPRAVYVRVAKICKHYGDRCIQYGKSQMKWCMKKGLYSISADQLKYLLTLFELNYLLNRTVRPLVAISSFVAKRFVKILPVIVTNVSGKQRASPQDRFTDQLIKIVLTNYASTVNVPTTNNPRDTWLLGMPWHYSNDNGRIHNNTIEITADSLTPDALKYGFTWRSCRGLDVGNNWSVI